MVTYKCNITWWRIETSRTFARVIKINEVESTYSVSKHLRTRKCDQNDGVLPLKAARRDVVDNLKCFWALGHQMPNFDGYIYIHYGAPPYSAPISAIYFLQFGNVWLGSFSA